MKTIAALATMFALPAFADDKPTDDETAKIKAAIAELGCEGGTYEKESRPSYRLLSIKGSAGRARPRKKDPLSARGWRCLSRKTFPLNSKGLLHAHVSALSKTLRTFDAS